MRTKNTALNHLEAVEKAYGKFSGTPCPVPDFWTSLPENSQKLLSSLKKWKKREIGISAGNRPVIALEYGTKEETGAVCDQLNSSLAAHVADPDPSHLYPEEFYGTLRRQKPVIVLQCAIHGNEYTGTVAALNLCHIVEHKTDLRGKKWDLLAEYAKKCRILVIPWMNPDGSARSGFPCYSGMPGKFVSLLTQGVYADGTPVGYPVKYGYPLDLAKTGYLGAYFNDAGFNLQYDYTAVEHQPETRAWMRYYLSERPDAVFNFHCDSGSMIAEPNALLPEPFQHMCNYYAGAVFRRLHREGFKMRRLSWQHLPGFGKSILSQDAGIYHTCGALPLTIELPTGAEYGSPANSTVFTPDEMLDIGLITLEELFFAAIDDGFRPCEYRAKVMSKLIKEPEGSRRKQK